MDDVVTGPVVTMPRDLQESWIEDREFAASLEAARSARDPLKRVLDLVGASAGLIILSPVFLIVAAAVVIETPGLPIFSQRRTGFGGRPFVILKFRSMSVCEDGARVVQAVQDDHRITRVGRLIRRMSIDELPQLVNVLKGEMSLVGPRPHALAHDAYYGGKIPGYRHRFTAKPGVTGLAQVSGLRGRTETIESMIARVEKDREYIDSWSIWLDIKILFRTVLICLFHPSAY